MHGAVIWHDIVFGAQLDSKCQACEWTVTLPHLFCNGQMRYFWHWNPFCVRISRN